jgi:hypothetical protein
MPVSGFLIFKAVEIEGWLVLGFVDSKNENLLSTKMHERLSNRSALMCTD